MEHVMELEMDLYTNSGNLLDYVTFSNVLRYLSSKDRQMLALTCTTYLSWHFLNPKYRTSNFTYTRRYITKQVLQQNKICQLTVLKDADATILFNDQLFNNLNNLKRLNLYNIVHANILNHVPLHLTTLVICNTTLVNAQINLSNVVNLQKIFFSNTTIKYITKLPESLESLHWNNKHTVYNHVSHMHGSTMLENIIYNKLNNLTELKLFSVDIIENIHTLPISLKTLSLQDVIVNSDVKHVNFSHLINLQHLTLTYVKIIYIIDLPKSLQYLYWLGPRFIKNPSQLPLSIFTAEHQLRILHLLYVNMMYVDQYNCTTLQQLILRHEFENTNVGDLARIIERSENLYNLNINRMSAINILRMPSSSRIHYKSLKYLKLCSIPPIDNLNGLPNSLESLYVNDVIVKQEQLDLRYLQNLKWLHLYGKIKCIIGLPQTLKVFTFHGKLNYSVLLLEIFTEFHSLETLILNSVQVKINTGVQFKCAHLRKIHLDFGITIAVNTLQNIINISHNLHEIIFIRSLYSIILQLTLPIDTWSIQDNQYKYITLLNTSNRL